MLQMACCRLLHETIVLRVILFVSGVTTVSTHVRRRGPLWLLTGDAIPKGARFQLIEGGYLFKFVLELDVLLVTDTHLLLVHLTKFLRNHRTCEEFSCIIRLLLLLSLSWLVLNPVDLVFQRFPLLHDLGQTATQIFHLEMRPCNWTLVLLSIFIVCIDPFVIIQVYILRIVIDLILLSLRDSTLRVV